MSVFSRKPSPYMLATFAIKIRHKEKIKPMKILALFIALFAISSEAVQVDCSLLDPRVSVSTESKGEIDVAVDTLYKIAKVDTNIEGTLKKEILNLQQGSKPISENYAIAARTIYIFCGMVANAKDIGTERKVELFNAMQKAIQLPPVGIPDENLKSSEKSNKAITPPIQRGKNSEKANVVNCSATHGVECTFRSRRGQQLSTLIDYSGMDLAEVPTNHIWDSLSYTNATGLFVVCKGGLCAIYSRIKDALIFDYKYEYLYLVGGGPKHQFGSSQLSDYYIEVSLNGHHGIVTSEDKLVIPINYDHVNFLPRGKHEYWVLINSNKWGLADGSGNILFETIFDEITPWETDNGTLWVRAKQAGREFCMDGRGQKIICP